MYTLIRTEDFNSYVLRHFMCDDISELSEIISEYKAKPINELYPGWTAMVATSSSTDTYILKNDKQTWTKVSTSGGSTPGPEPSPGDHYIYDGGGVSGW